MKIKKIITIAFVFCCMTINAAEQVDSLELGNCTRGVATFISLDNTERTGGSALYYPTTTMQLYTECQITAICLNLADYTSVTSLRVFITKSLDGTPEYEQYVTILRSGWNSIALDEPYTPDGSAIYIGYELTGSLYISYALRREEGEEWYSNSAGKWTKYTQTYSAAMFGVVRGENLPKHNVRLKSTTMPQTTDTGQSIPVDLIFSNLGAETVNSVELTYTVDEKEYTETIDGLDVPYKDECSISASGLTIEEAGTHNVTVSITAVNGSPDLDMSDNTSSAVSVTAQTEYVQRKVLMEVFSTTRCPNCPEAHELIESVIKDKPDIIEMCHHSGFYTDEFTIDASTDYEWFYASNLYAPALMLDRTNMSDDYPDYCDADSPVFNVGSNSNKNLLEALCNKALEVPAYVSLNVNVKAENRDLTINVSGKKLISLDAKNYRLFVFLIENNLATYNQSGANPGSAYYYQGSPRSCLTGSWGDKVSLDDGFENQYSITLSDEWNANEMAVIAFVSTYDAGNRNDCRILNTESYSLAELFPSGINIVSQETDLQFDGKTLYVPVACSRIEVFNSSGVCIASEAPTDGKYSLEGNQKGIYIIRISMPNGAKTVKIAM